MPLSGRGLERLEPVDLVGGELDLPFESLPLEAGATTSLVTYLAEPGSPSHDALALLASWAAGAGDASRSWTAGR